MNLEMGPFSPLLICVSPVYLFWWNRVYPKRPLKDKKNRTGPGKKTAHCRHKREKPATLSVVLFWTEQHQGGYGMQNECPYLRLEEKGDCICTASITNM